MLKTYSPDDVKIIFGAFPIASGLADGTFINVDPMGDGTTSPSAPALSGHSHVATDIRSQ